MRKTVKLVLILALLVLAAAPTLTAQTESVPADWSLIGQSMVWDGEADQYMVCEQYISQTCFNQCVDEAYYIRDTYECADKCTRTRCYLVI